MEVPRLSELTPMIFNIRLTHLGSEASKYHMINEIAMKYKNKLLSLYALVKDKLSYIS